MTLNIQSLDDLDAELVERTRQELRQLIVEKFPALDLDNTALGDLVLYLGSVICSIQQTAINRYLAVRSLAAIEANPELATKEDLDHALSNFRLVRLQGTRASGEVSLRLQDGSPLVLSTAATYTAAGQTFRLDRAITATLPGVSATTSDSTRLLAELSDGSFEVRVPVTATQVGTAGNIRRDTTFSISPAPAGLLSAAASNDFSGGTTTENNTQLVARAAAGISAAVATGATNIFAMLQRSTATADVSQISVIGVRDREMRRDRRSIWPGSFGGRGDVYIRSSPLPASKEVTVTCTFVEKLNGLAVWQANIGRDAFPGFYDVVHIRRADSPISDTTLAVESIKFGVDTSGYSWTPDVADGQESRFSRYQTAFVRFLAPGSTAGDDPTDFVLLLRGMPRVLEVQELLGSDDHRPQGQDLLVKATVPCFVSVSLDIRNYKNYDDSTLAATKAAISDKVHSLQFAGELYASQIIDAARDSLPVAATIGDVTLTGRILRPDNSEVIQFSGKNVLRVPNNPDIGVSPKTVSLFVENIWIAVGV